MRRCDIDHSLGPLLRTEWAAPDAVKRYEEHQMKEGTMFTPEEMKTIPVGMAMAECIHLFEIHHEDDVRDGICTFFFFF